MKIHYTVGYNNFMKTNYHIMVYVYTNIITSFKLKHGVVLIIGVYVHGGVNNEPYDL